MNPIKEFFQKKKTEMKFKTAGRGHKLNETVDKKPSKQNHGQTSSKSTRHELSEGAQKAGAAALARIEQKPSNVDWSLQATKAQARKEIDIENTLKAKLALSSKEIVNVIQDSCPTLTVSGVYFKCPMVGPDVLPKKEIKQKIRDFLFEQLELERGLTSCLIIHTLNENKEKIHIGIETLARYITNILDNPEEEKYRKIRFNNKVFQERIVGLEGAFDFLTAAGFCRQLKENEDYFIFREESVGDLENLQMLKEALLSAEPIVPTLDRNLKVLKPSEATVQIKLPDDFFNLTAVELKKEQEAKAESVDLMTQLRTKAMRERDEVKELHMYKYTLIRIRFPDGIILQGTFYVHEKLLAVKEFISDNLCDPTAYFHLMLPGGSKLTKDDISLLELKLIPAVLLNFLWSNDNNCNKTVEFLKPETMSLLADL